MAATFSPEFVIDITDQIASGSTATITLPRGSWNLSSITATGSALAGTTITVGTALVNGPVLNTTQTLPATDPSVVFTGTITVACGGGGNLNDIVLRLSAAIGQTLAITVA
jgi:hypothetical protein